jgi:HK97 family phage prohead protease
MEQKITRAYDFEMRTEKNEEHGDHVVGMPIVFDSRTDLGFFDEMIDSHALDNTDLKDVRFLVNHDTSKIPLARSRNNNANSTMQMEITEAGMNIRVDLDTENNSDARNLYSAIKRGDISGMSFAFLVDGEEWTDLESDHPTRTITSISRVLEVSAVTFPAYEATSISARSEDEKALESARSALESVKRAEKLEKLNNLMKEVNFDAD